MGKTVLISNKTYNGMSDVGINFCHDGGNVYTADRLYATINETFEYQLRAKNRFLGSFVNYWFQTTDYKKNKKLSNIKPARSDIFYTLFFWACIIGLVACVIWGIAIPVINSAIKSIQLLQGSYTGVLMANDSVVGFVFDGKVVASAINSVANADVKDPDQIVWFNQYYEQYWKGLNNNGTIQDCQKFLRSFIVGTLGNANATVTYLPKELQVFMYFNTVGNTVSDAEGWTNLHWMANKNMLSGLSTDNVYYDLRATDICLAGNQMAQTLLVPKIWIAWFKNANVIIPLIFTLLLVILVWTYRYQIKKVRPRTNAMSIQDYVMAKVVFAKKWRWFLRKRVPMVEGVKELNHRFLFAAGSLGAGGIYFNVRLLNYLYATFREMNIVLVIPFGDNDAGIAELQKVIAQDFQNISLTIVDDELAAKFSSLDSSGNFFRFGGKPMNQDIETISVKEEQTQQDVYRLQFTNQVEDFYRVLNEERNEKIKRAAIKYGSKIDADELLTFEQRSEIFHAVEKQQDSNQSNFIAKQEEMMKKMADKSMLSSTTGAIKKATKVDKIAKNSKTKKSSETKTEDIEK